MHLEKWTSDVKNNNRLALETHDLRPCLRAVRFKERWEKVFLTCCLFSLPKSSVVFVLALSSSLSTAESTVPYVT